MADGQGQTDLQVYYVRGVVQFYIDCEVRAGSELEALGEAAQIINNYNIHRANVNLHMSSGGKFEIDKADPNVEWFSATTKSDSEDDDE